ncbi:MAG: COG1470 family protein [Candidatus Micrarchaeaceae archaeon]
MQAKILYFAVFAAFLMALSNATYLNILGPTSQILQNNQSIYLGKVGPGESFYVLASSSTTNSTGFLVNIGWDRLQVVNLPQGWYSQPSPLYETPMKIKVTVAPDAPYGIYNITLEAVNVGNYSRLGNITDRAYVNVTPDVFNLSVTPTNIQTGIGQPTNLYITINNTGISDDPFNINIFGLAAWNQSDQVVALHSTKSTYVYPVYVNEPGNYQFNLTVSSTTSPSIQRSYRISLVSEASLLNDYSAVGQGVILSPVILEPSYALMLLLSYLHNLISH